ncbi:MAG: LysR family transcriptional regulator [Cohaesibacter sp.]|jgi:DNA-binding transcriptional LysR family regulator|nr:LysR family transcriptional regulator [Cohaesibacter sp.]
MNWDDLQLFHAAATAGSMTGAARRLEISQPQLSRRLRQMEEGVGARLFDRTPQGLRLTTAGETLLPLAEKMRTTADAILRLQPNLSDKGLKKIRLSIDDLRVRFLIRHLPQLKEKIGDIELDLIATHQHLNLMNRSTDLQIRTCLPDSDTAILRKLADISYAVYAHRDYLAARPEQSFAEHCITGHWIGVCEEPIWYPDQLCWLQESVSGPIQLRFNCMIDCFEAAKMASGLALLPRFLADGEPDLCCVSERQSEVTSPEHLIVNRDVLREPATRIVMDALIEIYRALY